VQEPGIVIVCQGRKRGYWADKVYLYDAQHYLAVSVPVPFTMETDASADMPLLAIYLTIDFTALARLALELDELIEPVPAKPVGMVSTPMDDALSQSVLRLLEAMTSPVESQLLGPAIVRRIHSTFSDRLTVGRLASEAGMSVSTFHTHFRTVTHASPMQYLKSVRLHQARLLMLREEKTASAACLEVGYESASQFSREFKRFFGRNPSEEVARLKSSFEMPRVPGGQGWVASH